MISIQDADGNLWCGGSIVTSNRIVTAAHCFYDKVKKDKMDKDKIQSFMVVAGTASPFEFQGE
jgi:V8-like Glu-specific endopeptidase